MGKQKQMRRWWQAMRKLNQLWRRQHQRRAKMPRWRWAARQPSVEIHRVDFSKMASGRSLWVFEQGARLPCEVTALWGNLVHALRAQCCQPYRAAAIQGGSHTGRQPYRSAAIQGSSHTGRQRMGSSVSQWQRTENKKVLCLTARGNILRRPC